MLHARHEMPKIGSRFAADPAVAMMLKADQKSAFRTRKYEWCTISKHNLCPFAHIEQNSHSSADTSKLSVK
jgi:hypothetical protein